jgi:hypothetical protein
MTPYIKGTWMTSIEYSILQQHNTFFSAAHGSFSKIDHILGHKASLHKYKKIEITLCILYDHNTIKLEPNNKRNSRKHSNISPVFLLFFFPHNKEQKLNVRTAEQFMQVSGLSWTPQDSWTWKLYACL